MNRPQPHLKVYEGESTETGPSRAQLHVVGEIGTENMTPKEAERVLLNGKTNEELMHLRRDIMGSGRWDPERGAMLLEMINNHIKINNLKEDVVVKRRGEVATIFQFPLPPKRKNLPRSLRGVEPSTVIDVDFRKPAKLFDGTSAIKLNPEATPPTKNKPKLRLIEGGDQA